ncbi:MAG: 2'-deoxycytidine 5'-triphosphate deaminase, partial [Aestuariivirga sp.]
MTRTSPQPQGILPARLIAEYCAKGLITPGRGLDRDQIQPASLDLRLGEWAYRVRASFLPGLKSTVEQRLQSLVLHRVNLSEGAVLETGCVYIVPLLESLKLPKGVSAAANPKSSTGRLDIFTRVIADHAQEFDTIADGYEGPLYAEISPRTFSILVRTGSRLSQIRFRAGAPMASDAIIRALHAKESLIAEGTVNIDNGLALTIDLSGSDKDNPVGFRAKRHSGLVDVDKKAGLE